MEGRRAVAVEQGGREGPELEDHGPDNSFELVWACAADLHRLGLHPEHLRSDLPRLLGL